MSSIIPDSYQAWRHCIEVECRLNLSADYIRERIAALENPRDFHTQQFVSLWGEAHRQQVLIWFRQAGQALAAAPSAPTRTP